VETIIVSGANRGIGLELTKRFILSGHKVIAGCREPDQAKKLIALERGHELTILPLDVTSADSVSQFALSVGEQCIDVLVNNAGVFGGPHQDADNMDYAAWLDTFSVNTISPLRLSMAFRKNLLQSERPRVVTLSSQMGALSRKSKGNIAYRSSKAALNKMLQVLALEWQEDGIICCPVHPGWVQTDMGGPQADITAEESAEGIVELVARLSAQDSGRFFCWDGREHDW